MEFRAEFLMRFFLDEMDFIAIIMYFKINARVTRMEIRIRVIANAN